MMLKQLALAGILGLSLTTLANAPIYAQDMMKLENPLEDIPDEELNQPVWAMSYPMASPGSIHLSHWTNYRRDAWRPGSADDVRFEQERRKDKMYREVRATYWDKMTPEQKKKDAEWAAEPVAFDYTRSSPGSIHLSHWMGIDRNEWMPGSVSDMKMMQEKEKDQMWYSEMKSVTWTDEDRMKWREPVAMTYPMASPGSLHLSHWADYTRWETMPGSVSEHRMDRDKMEREKSHSERRAMEKK